MRDIADRLDRLSVAIGTAVKWLVLAMVMVQFAVVLLRYVFGIGSIWMQESVLYLHGFSFMLAAAYALAVDAHVRVDILYRDARAGTRAWVDLIGAIVFVLPLCGVILATAAPYVAQSWAILEGSREASGIRGVYLLKSAILVSAGLMALQGVALAVRACAALAGDRTALDAFAGPRE